MLRCPSVLTGSRQLCCALPRLALPSASVPEGAAACRKPWFTHAHPPTCTPQPCPAERTRRSSSHAARRRPGPQAKSNQPHNHRASAPHKRPSPCQPNGAWACAPRTERVKPWLAMAVPRSCISRHSNKRKVRGRPGATSHRRQPQPTARSDHHRGLGNAAHRLWQLPVRLLRLDRSRRPRRRRHGPAAADDSDVARRGAGN